jgi:hypothetical protein
MESITAEDIADGSVTKYPSIPHELWMLWDGSGWVVSADDAPGGETYLVAFTQKEAKESSDYQEQMYGLTCVPVRVK